jgi:hypothetical protein
VRRLTAVVLCSLAVGGLGAPAARADPDPDTNKNAVIVTFTCGQDTVDVVTILQNAALAVHPVDESGVLVLVNITLVDQSTGEVLFAFAVPGFDHNKQETTTCTATNPLFPNALQIMEVVFRPGSP